MSDTGSVASRPVTRCAAAARGAAKYAQIKFTALTRGRALETNTLLVQKMMTPERAGASHQSPHGGDGAVDPLLTNDPWNSSNVQLSPAIIEAKHRVQAMPRLPFLQISDLLLVLVLPKAVA